MLLNLVLVRYDDFIDAEKVMQNLIVFHLEQRMSAGGCKWQFVRHNGWQTDGRTDVQMYRILALSVHRHRGMLLLLLLNVPLSLLMNWRRASKLRRGIDSCIVLALPGRDNLPDEFRRFNRLQCRRRAAHGLCKRGASPHDTLRYNTL